VEKIAMLFRKNEVVIMSCHSRDGGNPEGTNLNEADFVRAWNTNDTSKLVRGEEFETLT
jgi:hypothetical protein